MGAQEESTSASRTEMHEDEYKDPNVIPKLNNAMAEIIKSIKEYLRPCQDVVRAPLA